MSTGQTPKDRVRAWILLRAGYPDKVAKAIYDQFGKDGGNEFVVVRADVVDGDYNIVIPIDAADQSHFSATEKKVTSLRGVTSHITLTVTNHYPTPTYLAHGFTTLQDFADKLRWIHPDEWGRVQKKSPGDNPWG
jgi:hypothetical protein